MKTPKTSGNGSRKRLSSIDSTALDCRSLEHSLKRVRLTCSPGELCLQRDLKHLLGSCWRRVEEGDEFVYQRDRLLLRHAGLRLTLVVDGTIEVDLRMDRHYPHVPPTVDDIRYHPPTSIKYRDCPRSIVISLDTSMLDEDDFPEDGAILRHWTPIKRLSDVIDEIVELVRHPLQRSYSSSAAHHHNGRHARSNEADCATEPDSTMLDVHLHVDTVERVFPPGRFEVGYEQTHRMQVDL